MNFSLTKRILSFVLMLALLMGNFPAVAFATEEEIPAPTEVVAEETTAPTEVVTEETAAATEEPAAVETSAPTEAATEPVVETIAPTEEAAEPEPEKEPALEPQSKPESETVKLPIRVNPLYKDIFSAKDFPRTESAADDDKESGQFFAEPAYLSLEDAAKELRKHMVSRDESFTLYFKASSKNYESHLTSMLNTAVQHTGNPKEGDYLQWHFAGWGGEIEYYRDGSTYYYTFKAEMVYTTTTAQENELSKTITKLIDKLDIRDKSEYQKVKAIYDYICENVTYDREHFQDDTYLLKYSAYAALVKKTAVAEGYATLIYRILLELGMDTRVIAGLDMDGAAHVWNITRIGDVYYNLDATWDAGSSEHVWFLRNTINFPNHYRYLDYNTFQFHTDYPMAQDDHIEGVPGVPDKYFIIGMCGDEVAFAIDRERNLVIAGNGPMWNFTSISDGNKDNCPPWYYWMNAFEHVVIEEGVTTIGTYAFERMSDITAVTLPDTLVEIGDFAFGSLPNLEAIVLPPNLESVGDSAFASCSKLTEIAIPDSVKTIGNSAFSYCRLLTSATFGKNLKSIGDEAFSYCQALTEVILPEGLLTLGARVFSHCTQLQSVSLGKSLQSIGAEAFYYCSQVAEILLPETLTTIGQSAFYRCGITEIVIPDSVTTMGSEAFRETMNLQSAKWNKTLTTIPSGTFRSCLNLTGFDVPASVTSIQSYAFASTGLREILIPDTVNNLGKGAFCGCGSLKYAKLSNQLTSISSELFASSGLSSIEIPAGVQSIDSRAFDRSRLKTIRIPDSVTWIGEEAFNKCEQLESVILPEGLYGMSASVFAFCSKLTEVTLPDSLESLGKSAFYACTSLTNIVIPDKVYAITDSAFGFCKSLTNVLLPESVGKIDINAFYHCEKLTSITIPASMESIGAYAFRGCEALGEIVFMGDAPVLSREMFADVTATAYYPFGNETWTEGVRKNYGGTITWVARCLNHEYSSVEVVAPTCTENGYTRHFCPVCGDGYYTDETEMLGHDISEWQVATDATCTEEGELRRDCNRCDYFETDVIAALGHTVVVEEGIPVTCTEDGLSEGSYCTACGVVFQIQEVIPARGHAIKSAAAVAPTCTEIGLTEGSYCINCGEAFIPQEEIPALGHDFASVEDGIACNNCGETMTIHIPQDYALMSMHVLESVRLAAEVYPAYLAEYIRWSVEDDAGIISVDQDGTVTALNVGTAYVAATLSYEEFEISTRCRIDVTEELQIAGIQLSTDKLTSELYSTNYASFEILLQLPQNNQFAAVDSQIPAEDMGIAIESARFENETMAELFEIRVLDDRNVIIVPTDYAVNNPKSVAGKYTGKVVVTVQGEEFTSENLTLTVKKTLPKLKATVPAFNSFYSGQSQQIVITGGTATKVYPNPAQKAALPNWLNLTEDGTLTLNEQVPLKSASAKAYLLVDTEEWRIPAAVTVSVKNTYKARGLKLSASGVTFTTIAENSDGVAMKLLSTEKNKTLADLKVIGITAPAGYIVENFNISDGSFILKTEAGFKTGTINLGVTFEDTDVAQPLKLTVKTAKITLKASVTKVTLNTGRNDSAFVDIIPTPADYQITDPVITLTGTELVNKKKVTVDKLNSGELDVAFEDGKLRIATTSKTPDKASYKLTISAGGSKAVAITVNTVSANPTVTYKATGSMDLSFPDQTATITPTFKNCGNGFDSFEYSVAEMKGKTVVNENVTNAFEVTRDGNLLKIRCVNETVNTSNTYALKLRLILEDGNSVENTISLKVKRTAIKLKLSTTKLTLNKLIGDKAEVSVTCTTKGYDFTEPVLELKDSKNNNAAGQLDINFNNGQLHIATNEATVYGASYKVLVKANTYAPATTLSVTIPKADKSAVTATVKASGSIDVIRDGSSITLTPTYKNVTAQTEKVESLVFYKTANKVTTEANELFSYVINENGTITITKAKDAELDHSAKYTVKLVTDVNGNQVCESKAISISVKMGSAKLTLKANDTMLFAQDKHDRVVFRFDSADKALNEVVKVEIKDAKYKDIFEVYDYGNGEFAIGFKDNSVSEKLIGKKVSLAVTLNLNVFIDGNESAKPNTTAKIKLTIVK